MKNADKGFLALLKQSPVVYGMIPMGSYPRLTRSRIGKRQGVRSAVVLYSGTKRKPHSAVSPAVFSDCGISERESRAVLQHSFL